MSANRFIAAPKEVVWKVISNVGKEMECWPSIRSIVMIGQERRQILTIFGTFVEAVDVKPGESMTVSILDGPFTGSKTIELKVDGSGTIVDIRWDICTNRKMKIFSFLVKRYVMSQTLNALERMAAITVNEFERKHRS